MRAETIITHKIIIYRSAISSIFKFDTYSRRERKKSRNRQITKRTNSHLNIKQVTHTPVKDMAFYYLLSSIINKRIMSNQGYVGEKRLG